MTNLRMSAVNLLIKNGFTDENKWFHLSKEFVTKLGERVDMVRFDGDYTNIFVIDSNYFNNGEIGVHINDLEDIEIEKEIMEEICKELK